MAASSPRFPSSLQSMILEEDPEDVLSRDHIVRPHGSRLTLLGFRTLLLDQSLWTGVRY